uniref:Pyridine nucleotide-disulphide oxidoreductase n=1 Tax=Candidatus Kentrum sp. TUN TaxID=2126343 RepID=A0A451A2V6_9GAMM|nr:MAG: Pyridine nucleotide-disulphide oxidoreductase [Candidatus Kentron sp. TUN]VFK69762.1 MAG: Pyridine nucleotide-disulphide oxidoreductase [Candidatus Kentron sp. TUN]
MRWDWNSLLTDDYDLLFKDYSKDYFPDAEPLIEYLEAFAAKYLSNIQYNADIVRVSRDENGFHAKTRDGKIFSGKCLIVATGVSKPWSPVIGGIEMAEQYSSVSEDPEEFADQRILIIGKGNSGFETADNLIGHAATIHVAGPELLEFDWQSHYVEHLRAVNNNFIITWNRNIRISPSHIILSIGKRSPLPLSGSSTVAPPCGSNSVFWGMYSCWGVRRLG